MRRTSVPLRRLEHRHPPPEGGALSTELQGRAKYFTTTALAIGWKPTAIDSSSSPRSGLAPCASRPILSDGNHICALNCRTSPRSFSMMARLPPSSPIFTNWCFL